jgi:hypothetical protein
VLTNKQGAAQAQFKQAAVSKQGAATNLSSHLHTIDPQAGCAVTVLLLQVFDVATGRQLTLLSQGHFDMVTACVYSPHTGQLWSAGMDGAVLAWEPWQPPDQEPEENSTSRSDWWLAAAAGGRGSLPQQGTQAVQIAGRAAAGAGVLRRMAVADVDAWSDDDDI